MSKGRKRESEFWSLVHQMHLYESGGEALFKGLGLVATWCGTILIYMINGVTVGQDTLLFFALSIILEYAVQFVSTHNRGTPKQYLTGSLTLLNFFVYIMALIQLKPQITNQTVAEFFYFFQLLVSFCSIIVIFLDTLITVCVNDPADKPKKKKLETKLKNL